MMMSRKSTKMSASGRREKRWRSPSSIRRSAW
jgi:hypothetical protein